jgi:hypothetical protein
MEVRRLLDNILDREKANKRVARAFRASAPDSGRGTSPHCRELHDSIAQELAAVSMNLDELQKRIEGRDRAGDNLLSDSMGTGACRRPGAEGSESLEFGGALLATPRSCKQLPSRRNRLRMFPVGATLLPYLRLYTAVCAGDGFPAEEQVASIRVFPSFT